MIPFDDYNYKNKLFLKHLGNGKVRNLYDLVIKDYNKVINPLKKNKEYMILQQSNRCSAFDYHICDVKNKGYHLTQIAAFWFKNTNHIIDNHYISHKHNMMLVKKMLPIKLEFIARGYITGSCWRSYERGDRTLSGEHLPENLTKNCMFKHEFPIITPTTKDVHDIPITLDEIINKNILTQEQLNFIVEKIKSLYLFGYSKMLEKNIIMADTKYEFGFDDSNNIILIDEIHTPDSSRFWCLDSYKKCQELNDFSSLEHIDKDIVRNYLLSKGFPKNTQEVPDIPVEVQNELDHKYYHITKSLLYENQDESKLVCDINNFHLYLYNDLGNNHDTIDINDLSFFNNCILERSEKIVIIVAGSKSDKYYTNKVLNVLTDKKILGGVVFASAHKETEKVINFIKDIECKFDNIIWVTMAGMSNALSGVFAANTKFPTIGCPVFKSDTDLLININSTLQMPSKVPVMTILSSENVGIACQKIFNLIK